MKVQCEVCERKRQRCCAVQMRLCYVVDVMKKCMQLTSFPESIHASLCLNIHLLIPLPHLLSFSCDICQERNGYFFCLEDRAILCRHCDMSTHNTASSIVSSHQRFLIGGIKVALESSTNDATENTGFKEGVDYQRLKFSSSTAINQDVENNLGETAGTSSEADPLASAASASASWPLDNILGTDEFNCYDFSDMESSRITDP